MLQALLQPRLWQSPARRVGSVSRVRSALGGASFPLASRAHACTAPHIGQHHRGLLCSAALANDEPVTAATGGDYDAGQIQVLEGLEPVRRRPGMYIGSTGSRGLHHLVYEILDNAIDEVQAGHASMIKVDLQPDGWVSVYDNGRGIPTDLHPRTGKSALETVLTVLHAGGKFGGDDSGYKVSGGLHGVGISVVNALSEELEVSVWRKGQRHEQRFVRGVPEGPLHTEEDKAKGSKKRGTLVRFKPDPKVFKAGISLDYGTLASRHRELAFLNSRVHIWLRNSRDHNGPEPLGEDEGWEEFHFAGGLLEYVQWMNRDNEPLHEPITFSKEEGGVVVEASLQWCQDSYSEMLLGYANSIRTVDGGTHIDGFKSSLTRTLNKLAVKHNVAKEGGPRLSGEHCREGLKGVVSVKVPEPEFEGQTKTRLGNPEVRKLVDGAVSAAVEEALELNPAAMAAVLRKATAAMKAAEAAKKARELVRKKSVLRTAMLPGKLSDCSAGVGPEGREIFLVEGDSAGGSAKQARDRRFQAILPLRGKILNVERRDDSTIYKNQEIANLILALGLGLKGEEFDVSSLRYHKIVILTDADVDGAHIRTLLLTFLFRYQPALFDHGHVYVGVPPLYKVESGGGSHYCYDEGELAPHLQTLNGAKYSIQRFKGLGEMMPQQLWETTLDPAHRRMRRLTTDDAAESDSMVSTLMGDKVGPRRLLIEEEGARLQLRDLDL